MARAGELWEVGMRSAPGVVRTWAATSASSVQAERVREAHAELRELAQAVDDPAIRSRLHAVCDRLAGPADVAADPRDGLPAPRLAPRELDVLAEVALGRTNAEVGERLGVFPETVKAYLRSAMRKLQAHTRYEAVVAARRCGLLP